MFYNPFFALFSIKTCLSHLSSSLFSNLKSFHSLQTKKLSYWWVIGISYRVFIWQKYVPMVITFLILKQTTCFACPGNHIFTSPSFSFVQKNGSTRFSLPSYCCSSYRFTNLKVKNMCFHSMRLKKNLISSTLKVIFIWKSFNLTESSAALLELVDHCYCYASQIITPVLANSSSQY